MSIWGPQRYMLPVEATARRRMRRGRRDWARIRRNRGKRAALRRRTAWLAGMIASICFFVGGISLLGYGLKHRSISGALSAHRSVKHSAPTDSEADEEYYLPGSTPILPDPGIEGWDKERDVPEMELQLGRLLQFLTEPATVTVEAAGNLAAADFASASLRAETPAVLHQDDQTYAWEQPIRNESQLPTTFRGASGLAEALRELTSSFKGVEPVRWRFELVSLETSAAVLTTRVRWRASGRSEKVGVDYGAIWNCRWNLSDRSRPRLTSIRVERADQCEARVPNGRWLVDATTSVLGNNPSFTDQLHRGANDWSRRIQRQYGVDFFARRGLAIGDVNGDGRDDLYVCQMGGLPNLLFVQQPDGTAKDLSIQAGVDLLDASVAALFLDIDTDGDQDLAVLTTQGLFWLENSGSGQFRRRLKLPAPTQPAGLSAADVDGDGDLDLFLTSAGATVPIDPYWPADHPFALEAFAQGTGPMLLRQDGEWKFVDATRDSGLPTSGALAASWEDFDEDGRPDLAITSLLSGTRLLRNVGGKFIDVTKSANLDGSACGAALAWGDLDRDGRSDLVVFGRQSALASRLVADPRFATLAGPERQQLWQSRLSGVRAFRNQEDGTFRDVSPGTVNLGGWCTSGALADLNNDGWIDLFSTRGGITQSGKADIAGVFWRRLATLAPAAIGADTADARGLDANQPWARAFLEVRLALLRARDFAPGETNTAALNLGTGRWIDAAIGSGFDFADDAFSLAMTDWDRDGHMDVWTISRGSPQVRFLRNQVSESGNWLELLPVGKTPNRDAVGARVEIVLGTGARKRVVTVRAGEGQLAQSSRWLHFGLGDAKRIERVVVRWPNRASQDFGPLALNKRYRLVQGGGAEEWSLPTATLPKEQKPLSAGQVLGQRIPLGARPPLPSLVYADLSGETRQTDSLSPAPTLVVFWSNQSQSSVELLRELAGTESEVRQAGLNVLALCVDGSAAENRLSAALPAAQNALRGMRFPFSGGVLDADGLKKIEALDLHLFGPAPGIALPLSLLLDAEGRIAVVYKAAPGLLPLVSDAGMLGADYAQQLQTGVPIHGRWFVGMTDPGFDTLAQELERMGFWADGRRLRLEQIAWFDARPDSASKLRRKELAASFGRRVDAEAAKLAGENKNALAAECYRQVLRVAPDDVTAQEGLARLLLLEGQPEEAVSHFLEAIRLGAGGPELFANFALALFRIGRAEEGMQRLRQAVALPNPPQWILLHLAWTLATHPNPRIRDGAEAATRARRLCDETSYRNAEMMDALAAALAEQGEFADAAAMAQRAMDSARTAGKSQLAAEIETRLRLYQSYQPCRDRQIPTPQAKIVE